jgi:hypothetical protein
MEDNEEEREDGFWERESLRSRFGGTEEMRPA